MIRKIYSSLLLLFISFGSLNAGAKDSLNAILLTSKVDSVRASAYFSLGRQYARSNLDSARFFFLEAASLYSKIKLQQKSADALNSVAITFAMQGEYDSAVKYVKQAYDTYKKFSDSLKMAFALNNLGLMNTERHRYTEGIEYLLESLKLKRKLSNEHPPEILDVASTEHNIGVAFHYLKDYENALRYYQNATESYGQHHNNVGLSKTNLQIANLYYDLREFEKADSVYSFLLSEEVFSDDYFALSKLYKNYGDLLAELGQYDKATTLLKEAYTLNQKLGHLRSASINLTSLGRVEMKKGNYAQAIEKGLEAYELSGEINQPLAKQEAASFLIDAYERVGNYQQALYYSKVFQVLADSLFRVDKISALADLEAQYRNAEKEKLILQQEVELSEVKRSRQMLIVLFIFAIVFSAFTYYLFWLRKKQNLKLKKLIETKDKLISIIAHDLKNPAIAQKLAIEQLMKQAEVMNDKDLHKSISTLFQASDSQVSLLLNLLNWAHTQTGPLKPNPVAFNLNDVVTKNMKLFFTSSHNKNLKIHLDAEEVLLVNADKPMINTVIRNLVSNAIKFSLPGGVIEIKLFRHNSSEVALQIRDSGVGMTKDKLERLFNLDKRELGKGTSGEEGSGLGLFLCREMVAANGGQLSIKSEINEGTEVVITIPSA